MMSVHFDLILTLNFSSHCTMHITVGSKWPFDQITNEFQIIPSCEWPHQTIENVLKIWRWCNPFKAMSELVLVLCWRCLINIKCRYGAGDNNRICCDSKSRFVWGKVTVIRWGWLLSCVSCREGLLRLSSLRKSVPCVCLRREMESGYTADSLQSISGDVWE